MIKLTLKDSAKETPEVRKHLDYLEKNFSEIAQHHLVDLVVYGYTEIGTLQIEAFNADTDNTPRAHG